MTLTGEGGMLEAPKARECSILHNYVMKLGVW